jgi:hypothetical protein
MIKANYISVDEFKDWNPETDFSDYSVVTLSGMIARASDWVDNYLGYSLMIEDIENELTEATVTTDGDLIIFPRKIPIVAVYKIGLKLGQYDTDLILEDESGTYYDIPEPRHHIVYPFQQLQLTGKVALKDLLQVRTRLYFTQISYRAGYETIPDAIKDAVNLVAKDIFMRQANPMGLGSVSQGGISMSYRSGESDLIKRAKELLEPYVRRY